MVREGFKETEIGEIPEEWEVVALKEAFSISTISILPFLFPRTKFVHYSLPAWDDFKAPVIEDGFKIGSNKFLIQKNCVLVSKLNPRKPRVVVVKILNFKMKHCASTEFIAYFPVSSNIDLDFYGFYFLSSLFHEKMQQVATGTTNSHVRAHPTETYYWVIPYPPFPEQRRIAGVLLTLDEAIEKTEVLIAKLRQVKTGLMRDLLTKGIDEQGRIRSEATHAFKDTAIGRMPAEWEVDLSHTYCRQIVVGVVCNATDHYVKTGGAPFLRSQNIKPNSIDTDELLFISQKFNQRQKKSMLSTNDIVIVRTGYPGTAAVVPKGLEGSNCFSLIVATPNIERILPTFFSYYLNSEMCKREIMKYQFGSAQNNFNIYEMKMMAIGVPILSEQRNIIGILSAMDTHINREEAYRTKLLAMKKGLMADLLTGRVRVPAGVTEAAGDEAVGCA